MFKLFARWVTDADSLDHPLVDGSRLRGDPQISATRSIRNSCRWKPPQTQRQSLLKDTIVERHGGCHTIRGEAICWMAPSKVTPSEVESLSNRCGFTPSA